MYRNDLTVYISPLVLMNNRSYFDTQNNFRIIFDQFFEKDNNSYVQLKQVITVFKGCDWYSNLTRRKKESLFGKGGVSKWLQSEIDKDNELKQSLKSIYKQQRNCIVGYKLKEETDCTGNKILFLCFHFFFAEN